jgi:hypothetical protein
VVSPLDAFVAESYLFAFKKGDFAGAASIDGMAISALNDSKNPPRQQTSPRFPVALASLTSLGFGASLMLHLVVLVSLSIVVLEHSQNGPLDDMWSAFWTEKTAGENGQPGHDERGSAGAPADLPFESGEITPDLTQSDAQLSFAPLIDIPQLQSLAIPTPALPARPAGVPGGAATEGSAGGGREGEFGGGFEFSIPKNGRAVIKGNFAAWTVPQDPKPKESYKIVIQIKLPKTVKNYALSDLSGIVEGTDQYKQPIPQNVRGFLPVVDHQTQLVVEVPGAEALVKDTIVIRSRVLRESQTLEIVF